MALVNRLTKSEEGMWQKPLKHVTEPVSDSEINEKYRQGEQRIVTETNREKLPNFVKALGQPNYMTVRPFYQRRSRWDQKKRSKLIESFIMNIPVPPLFLYERDFNKYEVMDGQQRISALHSFYNGEFNLSGLEIWPELNGRTYSTLPSQVRSGLDRRSISYIVVLRESSSDEESAKFLRQTVFERLNTGGVKLERQEIRNCLFQGPFNDLLLELARNRDFRLAFQLPPYEEDEDSNRQLTSKNFYKKMEDAELILRFFALRHADKYTRGMHGFLDLYMTRGNQFHQQDLGELREVFGRTIHVARQVYGDQVFRPFDPKKKKWKERYSKAFYDCVMVGICNHLEAANELVRNRKEILRATQALFMDNPEGTFTGRGNTRADIVERITKYDEMISQQLG